MPSSTAFSSGWRPWLVVVSVRPKSGEKVYYRRHFVASCFERPSRGRAHLWRKGVFSLCRGKGKTVLSVSGGRSFYLCLRSGNFFTFPLSGGVLYKLGWGDGEIFEVLYISSLRRGLYKGAQTKMRWRGDIRSLHYLSMQMALVLQSCTRTECIPHDLLFCLIFRIKYFSIKTTVKLGLGDMIRLFAYYETYEECTGCFFNW